MQIEYDGKIKLFSLTTHRCINERPLYFTCVVKIYFYSIYYFKIICLMLNSVASLRNQMLKRKKNSIIIYPFRNRKILFLKWQNNYHFRIKLGGHAMWQMPLKGLKRVYEKAITARDERKERPEIWKRWKKENVENQRKWNIYMRMWDSKLA